MLAATSIMAAATSPLGAAGYSKAEITRLHNDVKVLKENVAAKTASVGQQIDPVTSVATGSDSRAELRFPDKSLTRLGANSRFTLRGDSRTLDLESGVMLLQVPEQIRGAKVRTAAVTAAVTGGTALIEYLPGGYVKMIVIEGFVDVFLNSKPSEFKQFGPGSMLLMKSDGTFIPDGVEVDLKVLLKTSKLLSNNDDSSINQDLVNGAVTQQQKEIQKGDLQPTNLMLPGQGNIVIIDTSQRTDLFNNFGIRDGTPPPGQQGQGNPQNINVEKLHQDMAAFQGFAPLIAGKTVLNNNSTIVTHPHVTAYNVKEGQKITSEGTIYNGNEKGLLQYHTFGNSRVISPTLQETLNGKGDWALFRFEDLFINGTPVWEFPSGDEVLAFGELEGGGETPSEPLIKNVILASNNGIRIGNLNQFQETDIPQEASDPPNGEEGNVVLNLDTGYACENLENLILISNNGSITLRSDPEGFAISGRDQDVSIIGAGLGSDVNIEGGIDLEMGESWDSGSTLNVVAGNDVNVTSATVDASSVNMTAAHNVNINGGAVRANHGNLAIKAGLNINVTNSSQLKALLDTNTFLRLEAQGNGADGNSTINLDNVRLDSSGRIDLQANTGNITMNQVTSCSDVFKAITLSPSGWIIIGKSNITANTLLQLYGGTGPNGGVRFVDNATLNSSTVNISGYTVEIVNGKCVAVPNGNLNIDATNHQYNRTDDSFTPHVNDKGTFKVGSHLE
jgi:hypothetical protein